MVGRWKQIGIVGGLRHGLRRRRRQWSGGSSGSARWDQSSARVDARGSRSAASRPARRTSRASLPRPRLQQRPQLNSFACRLADFKMRRPIGTRAQNNTQRKPTIFEPVIVYKRPGFNGCKLLLLKRNITTLLFCILFPHQKLMSLCRKFTYVTLFLYVPISHDTAWFM